MLARYRKIQLLIDNEQLVGKKFFDSPKALFSRWILFFFDENSIDTKYIDVAPLNFLALNFFCTMFKLLWKDISIKLSCLKLPHDLLK